MQPKIRAKIIGYSTFEEYSRRDSPEPEIELENIIEISWSDSPNPPYQTARVSIAQPFDELAQIGLGVTTAAGDVVLRATGWLEITVDNIPVFFGLVSNIQTGVKVDRIGGRVSSPLRIQAQSWVSILQRGFRLSGNKAVDNERAILSPEQWGELIKKTIAVAEAKSLNQALSEFWSRTVIGQYIIEEKLLSTLVYGGAEQPNSRTTIAPVVGERLTQFQTSIRGTIWGVLTQTFQAIPALIDLFPSWDDGTPMLVYRMRPVSPNVNVVSKYWYEVFDWLDNQHTAFNELFRSIKYADPYKLSKIKSVSLEYDGTNRSNYIEVYSPFTGSNPLAGLSTDPVFIKDDISRYGLHPIEVPYPFYRESEGDSVRGSLSAITTYVSALYAEAHGYAVAVIESMYDDAPIGEWVTFDPYNTGKLWEGYVEVRTHRLRVNKEGAKTLTTQLKLSRVSPVGQTSALDVTTFKVSRE